MDIKLTNMELSVLCDALDAKTTEEVVLKIRNKMPDECQTAFRFHMGPKTLSLTVDEETVIRLYALLRPESPTMKNVKSEFKNSKLKLATKCPGLITALIGLKTKILRCFR